MNALLLSGGLDSAALAWAHRPDMCVTVDYGQRSALGERTASAALCDAMGLHHEILNVDLAAFGSGSMSPNAPVETAKAPEFWPYRNQMLITLAAMALLPRGLKKLLIGAVATDRHADGSPAFLRTVDELMQLQEGEVRIAAPAAHLTSVALLRCSHFPHNLIGLTFSCHVHRYACGQCAGCMKHREVVKEVYGHSNSKPAAQSKRRGV